MCQQEVSKVVDGQDHLDVKFTKAKLLQDQTCIVYQDINSGTEFSFDLASKLIYRLCLGKVKTETF